MDELTRRRSFTRWLRLTLLQGVLLAAAALLALFAAEMVARKRFPDLRYSADRQQRAEGLFIRFDPRYGWSNIPNRAVRFQRLEFDTEVRINEDGFRGPRIPESRVEGRYRILVLGDSYVFGHGVEQEETFCSLLATMLPGTEVLNFGVVGYSTDQELLLLRDRGLRYHPDLVVLCLYRNDILDNGSPIAWGLYRKPQFRLDGDGEPFLVSESVPEGVPLGMRIRRELRSRFVLYDLIAYRLAGGGDDGASDEALRSARALTRALVAENAELSEQSGAKFLLVVLPDLRAEPELWRDLPGEKLDLGPVFASFQQAHPDSELVFRYDSHWRPSGHRLVAETLAATIAPWIAAPASADSSLGGAQSP